jgi:hypothetical protein
VWSLAWSKSEVAKSERPEKFQNRENPSVLRRTWAISVLGCVHTHGLSVY